MVQQGCPDLTWVGTIDAYKHIYASKNDRLRREVENETVSFIQFKQR